MEQNIRSKLAQIQQTLKAPKNQFNKFGGYKYRSCEDIIEAVKPLCEQHGTILLLSDTVEAIGDRVYVRATVQLIDQETGDSISVTAYAREAESKKGMDESQIIGTASSYARKYALNGLFCIDDTADADTDAYTKQQQRGSKKSSLADKPAVMGAAQYVCADCGRPFEAFTAASGKKWMPEDVYNYAKQQSTDGVPRCKDCRAKAVQ